MPTTPDNQALCLDGPLNGSYQALNPPPQDYVPYIWPTDEVVLIHKDSPQLRTLAEEHGVA